MKKTKSLVLTAFLILNLFMMGGVLTVRAESIISPDGIHFDTNTGTITDYTGSQTNLIIPSAIEGVVVTSIGNNAFCLNNSLTSIVIPDSVQSLGINAFGNCAILASVTIGNGVTNIGEASFAHCINLTNVTIGTNVTNIDEGAFYNCQSLRQIVIPNSVQSIGVRVFKTCAQLTTIVIPSSVQSISNDAFEACNLLTIYGTDPSYAKDFAIVNSIMFSTDSLTLNGYSDNSNMQYQVDPSYTVIIPENVTIGESGGNLDIRSGGINTLLTDSVIVKILDGSDMATLTLYNQSDVSQQIHTVITKNAAQIDSQTELAVFNGLVTYGEVGGTLSLSKPTDTENKKAGIYTGTLTFTIAVEDNGVNDSPIFVAPNQ